LRVLLINSNQRDDALAAPPLGLCYVAGAAEAAGHEVRVLDLCFQKSVRLSLARALAGFAPEVVGVSLRNLDNCNLLYPISYLPEVRRLMGHLRELTGAPIVVGGSGASLCPREVLEYLQGDYIVVSDGELSFVQFLTVLGKGGTPANIPGVGLQLAGRFHLTPPHLHAFPDGNPRLGRWIDMAPYEKIGSAYTVQTKRGCRQSCIYCTYNQVLEGKRFRLRSPLEVVDELEEALHRYHPQSFEFVDSVFNDPIDHCLEILAEICRRPWKARFSAMGVSPRNLNRELLDLMQRAGFKSFMTSPESASETMLQNYQKGFTAEEVRRAAETVNQSRLPVVWFFLLGGPGETNDTLQETLDFISQRLSRRNGPPLNLAYPFLGVRIYPGTKLWDIAAQQGFVGPGSNPLEQLWYLSPGLDLDKAVWQLRQAARHCPEITLTYIERYLPLITRFLGILGNFLYIPKPYWQHLPKLQGWLGSQRLRFQPSPARTAARLRAALGRRC
jgi:radical SAM superfamily enzyme YgiQ (UPF0313 family)